ncbi:hypothetical protein Glo7428_4046 [Gloeocapsa sp. PCC 7428]|nr:hypothetical protein Glo7428_4046 [Gloeocapsa sp. PCC 7428]
MWVFVKNIYVIGNAVYAQRLKANRSIGTNNVPFTSLLLLHMTAEKSAGSILLS